MMPGFRHMPVLAKELLQYLVPHSGGVYVDGTLGGGGHSELILEATEPDGTLIGIDRDPEALSAAKSRLHRFGRRFSAIQGSFADIAELLPSYGTTEIDGLILDLGVSSYQLDTPERGFSFRFDGPLDMRMNPAEEVSAADLVNNLSEQELEKIIREYGEERWARKIAARIVAARQVSLIETTQLLAELVESTIPRRFHEERIHPATRTFQALRIAVNDELAQVQQGITAGFGLLRPGGRIAVVSFHSLEDRIVKQTFRGFAEGCICPPRFPYCVCGKKPVARVVTGKPVVAGEAERSENPRSRSAKLRIVEKL